MKSLIGFSLSLLACFFACFAPSGDFHEKNISTWNRTFFNAHKNHLSPVTCCRDRFNHAHQHTASLSSTAFLCSFACLCLLFFHPQSSPRFMAIKKWYIWIFIDILDLLLFNFCDKHSCILLSHSPFPSLSLFLARGKHGRIFSDWTLFSVCLVLWEPCADYRVLVHRLINHATTKEKKNCFAI